MSKTRTTKCINCNGKGYIKITSYKWGKNEETDLTCSDCDGSGKIEETVD